MFLRSVFYVSLLLQVHSYNDYLTHTALDQVPATIGDDLQIRCTKILKVDTDDYKYSRTAHCDPEYDDSCYHTWTMNGKKLSTGNKYSFKSSITFDYCETFERSTDIVKKLMLDVGEYSTTRYDREMKCYSSALTIKKVEVGDLGKYQCDFGKSYYTDVQSITVYEKGSGSVQQPKKVEYFEHFYTKGMKSRFLMQCVVTGGQVHWLIRLATEGCPQWADPDGDKCINNPLLALENMPTLDTWRCYNFTIESHNPYQDQDVTESFVYFENICRIDWGSIYCSPDLNGDVRSKGVYIVASHTDYYHPDEVLAFIFIPIVLGLFFIFGGILACSRGKVCNCCTNGSKSNLGTRVHVPYQQQVFGYAVPQQGHVPPHAGHAWSAPPHAGHAWSAPPNTPPVTSGASSANTTMVQVHPATGAGAAN